MRYTTGPAGAGAGGATPTTFGRLLTESGVSDTRFAQMVNESARRARRIELALARTTVGHWRRGMRPRDPVVAELAAAELSEVAGYTISPADLGWRGETADRDDPGLAVADTATDTIKILAGLSGRDMRRRDLLQDGTAFVATAFADPVLSSITGVVERLDGDARGPTPTGTMIRDMTATFRKLDARYGSAQIRPSVVRFLHDCTKTSMDGTPAPDVVGALGELTQFAGWLAQDSDRQSAAQRYYIQALGLAEHAGDAMLAGRALSAMSDQAARMHHPRHSLALARAALERSERESTAAVRAMLHDKHAWALARIGDEAACTKALLSMEKAISAAEPGEGPTWAAHYNDADVAECHGHCLLLLGRPEQAIAHLEQSRTRQSPDRARTRSYAEAGLAVAHLRRPDADVEAALDAGGRALDLASEVVSTRITDKLRELDTAFAAHDHVCVRRWRTRAAGHFHRQASAAANPAT
jgi:tetratricopeptide (TPR) repeat protein